MLPLLLCVLLYALATSAGIVNKTVKRTLALSPNTVIEHLAITINQDAVQEYIIQHPANLISISCPGHRVERIGESNSKIYRPKSEFEVKLQYPNEMQPFPAENTMSAPWSYRLAFPAIWISPYETVKQRTSIKTYSC